MTHPQDLSLRQQAEAIRHGDLSAKELLEATLERLRSRDSSINSTPVIFDELSQVQISQAPAGPLFGVPITVKDMFALPWRAARNGTSLNLIPAGASGPYRNLRDAGVIVVGVANQHELGIGSTGIYSAYGAMRNPWNPLHCAGGSSGGSAAAVGAHLVAGSLASDSGGSTRIPASFCGVVGLKLTYGSVPYDGYFGAATTFSAPGLVARDGGDTRMLTAAMLQRPLPQQSGSGLRVGLVREPYWNDVDHEAADLCTMALKLAGWKVSEVKIENLELAGAAFLGRLIAEAGIPSSEVFCWPPHVSCPARTACARRFATHSPQPWKRWTSSPGPRRRVAHRRWRTRGSRFPRAGRRLTCPTFDRTRSPISRALRPSRFRWDSVRQRCPLDCSYSAPGVAKRDCSTPPSTSNA
ncbi:MAG: amidase [Acidimicrobiales bacterium]